MSQHVHTHISSGVPVWQVQMHLQLLLVAVVAATSVHSPLALSALMLMLMRMVTRLPLSKYTLLWHSLHTCQ
jgi:hypothetical protein